MNFISVHIKYKKINKRGNDTNIIDDKLWGTLTLQKNNNNINVEQLANNNESLLWPNENKEFASYSWLDSIIISDHRRPKKEFETDLKIQSFKMQSSLNFDDESNSILLPNMKDRRRRRRRRVRNVKFNYKQYNLSNDERYTFYDTNAYQSQRLYLHTSMAHNLHPNIFPISMRRQSWINLHRRGTKLDCEQYSIQMDSSYLLKRNMIANEYELNIHNLYIPKNFDELSSANVNIHSIHKSNEEIFLIKLRKERIILLEYLEENPLLINNTGMVSSIITLYRKSQLHENASILDFELKVDDGIVRYLENNEKNNYFVGAPKAKQYLTIIDNNLYSAPIASHTYLLSNGIFLLTLKKKQMSQIIIRRIDAFYSVGQIQPKQKIYHNSKSREYKNYLCNRLKVHIHKKLAQKKRKRMDINLESLMNEFPVLKKDGILEILKSICYRTKKKKWIKKPNIPILTNIELQQMISPEQEILRQMFMNGYFRLLEKGLHLNLITCGIWKRILKNLEFSKSFVQNLENMKLFLTSESKSKKHKYFSLKLKVLKLIEEELSVVSWHLTDQFLRCKRGNGEMKLYGIGNPFKMNEGVNYLRDRKTRFADAIQLIIDADGTRAHTKADFRSLKTIAAKHILHEKFKVPHIILNKLNNNRTKILDLLQKKSREALAHGSRNKSVKRFARMKGSRKIFARKEYEKKVQKVMRLHIRMLRKQSQKYTNLDLDLFEMEEDDEKTKKTEKEKSLTVTKKKTKKIKKYKLKRIYRWTDALTHERKYDIKYFTNENVLQSYYDCIQENDSLFNGMRKWSKNSEILQNENNEYGYESGGGGSVPLSFNNNNIQEQRKYKRNQLRIKEAERITDKERELKLDEMERLKPHIKCSNCGRNGHNKNNKYCTKYLDKKREQLKNNYLIKKETHESLQLMNKMNLNQIQSRCSSLQANQNNSKPTSIKNDPRIDFIHFLKECMTEIEENAEVCKYFKKDPKTLKLKNYQQKIKHPMCLEWISDNIRFTEKSLQTNTKKKMERNENHQRLHVYKKFQDFKLDIQLIYNNSQIFNGKHSAYTLIAKTYIINKLQIKENECNSVIYAIENEMENIWKKNDLLPVLQKIIQDIVQTPMLLPLLKLDDFKLQMKKFILNVNENEKKSKKTKAENIKNKIGNQIDCSLSEIYSLYKIRQRISDQIYSTFEQFVYDLKKLQQFCWNIKINSGGSSSKNKLRRAVSLLGAQLQSACEPHISELENIEPNAISLIKLRRKPPFL